MTEPSKRTDITVRKTGEVDGKTQANTNNNITNRINSSIAILNGTINSTKINSGKDTTISNSTINHHNNLKEDHHSNSGVQAVKIEIIGIGETTLENMSPDTDVLNGDLPNSRMAPTSISVLNGPGIASTLTIFNQPSVQRRQNELYLYLYGYTFSMGL